MLQALIVSREPQLRPYRIRGNPAARIRPVEKLESEILALYIAGWSEADPGKIIEAAAPDYALRDGLVGQFRRQTMAEYFDILRARFAATGAIASRQLAFMLRGPMESLAGSTVPGSCRYWREAAELGLTGTADIVVSPRGVVADTVAYDLNMASEMLRGRHCD